MDSAVNLISLLRKHACVIANQRVVAPLTELVFGAALKGHRNRLASAHERVVLITQRVQIACHCLKTMYQRCPMSLLWGNDGHFIILANATILCGRK